MYLKMVGKDVRLKAIALFCTVLFSVDSKIFEKLANKKLEKCGLFSDFQYGSSSSRSTSYLVTVVSERIAGAINIFGATQAVVLHIWHFSSYIWLYLVCS